MGKSSKSSEKENKFKKDLLRFGLAILLIGAAVGSFGNGFYDESFEFSTEDSSLDDLLDLIQKKMNNNFFYSKEISPSAGTYGAVYMERIRSYLGDFYPYMSDEQIAILLNFIDYRFPMADYENTDPRELFDDFIDSLFVPGTEGYGIYWALQVDSSQYSDISRDRELHRGIGTPFTILANVVGYENLIPAIYSENMEGVINVICHETSIDHESARRLIELFDCYYEDYDKVTETKEDYLDEIKQIMEKIVQTKCKVDPVFRNGLFSSSLINSDYFKKDGLLFDVDYWNQTFGFQTNLDSFGISWVNLPYYYLNSNMDLDTVVDSAACFVIRDGYEDSNNTKWYDRKPVEMLSYIVPWNKIDYIANSDLSLPQKKHELFNALSEYFEDEKEFNEFLITLDMDRPDAIKRYFTIWKSKMMSGPVTIQKLLEFTSFQNSILGKTYFSTMDYGDYTYIEKGTSDILEDSYLNEYYFVCDYDTLSEFDEVRSYFHEQDSRFTELLSDSIYETRDWRTGDRKLRNDIDFPVLSKPLILQKKDIGDGHFIYYYVKPEGYPEGKFVRVFNNVENHRVDIEVPGVSTTLENEETGEAEEVLVVSFDEEVSINDVYYKVSYFDLYPKEKEQMITYSYPSY